MDDLLAQNTERLSLGLEFLSAGRLHRLPCDRAMRQGRVLRFLAWPLVFFQRVGEKMGGKDPWPHSSGQPQPPWEGRSIPLQPWEWLSEPMIPPTVVLGESP